jgi:hypothetical protein
MLNKINAIKNICIFFIKLNKKKILNKIWFIFLYLNMINIQIFEINIQKLATMKKI